MYPILMKIGRLRKIKVQKAKGKRQSSCGLFIKNTVRVLPFAFCLLPFALLYAADVQISASLDRQQVALNEQASLSVTISGSGNLPEPQLPTFQDFQISNAGRSQNFTWVNGQASASVTYNFALLALKEGHFTIPPIKIAGQAAETQPLSLDVVKGEANALPAPQKQPGERAQTGRGSTALFITGSADKSSVYVGEPLTYSFRLFNRVRLLRQPNYQPPQTSGFWAEDLPPQRNYQTTVKGVPYNVTEVRTALFPTGQGKATIGPATLSVSIENIGTDPFSDDFFASFFGRGEEKVLRTDPVAIRVKPLPDPKPANFKGAVGHYTIVANLDKDHTMVGQPLTLSITVAGRGNIKSLPDLPLPPLPNVRTFDPNAATNIEKKDGQVQGSKVFKTVLIPTASGDLQIPAVYFVFFDSDAHAYKTIASRPLTVHVSPAGPGGAAPAAPYSSAPSSTPGIRLLGEDIRYIRTPSQLSAQGGPLYKSRLFQIFNALFLFGVIAAALYRLYSLFFLSNTALARFEQAREETEKLMLSADGDLGRSDIKKSSETLGHALHAYLAAKLVTPESELSLKLALEKLRARGLHSHDTEKVRALWETFDLFQFAPTQVRPEEVRKSILTFRHLLDVVEKDVLWKD